MHPTNRFVIALALLLTTAGLLAQERRQGPAASGPAYDPKQETTVTGVVGRSYTIQGRNAEQMILSVSANGAPLELILGPADFVKQQNFTFTEGAKLEIVGIAGFQVNGEPAMLTRSIKTGAKTLTLRDATGKPVWEK